MRRIVPIFLVLASIGFALSLGVHLVTSVGVLWIVGDFLGPLHVGVFIVGAPAMILSNRLTKGHPRKDYWNIALRGCPRWMRRGASIIFGYCWLRMIVFLFLSVNQPKPHGAITAGQLAFFSSGWLAFYAMEFVTLYSFGRIQEDNSRHV